MIRRFSIGYDVELHKRTLECGLLSLIGPEAAAWPARPSSPSAEHAHVRRRRSPASPRGRSAPTSASTCCATPPTPRRCAALSSTPAPRRSPRTAVECLRVERGRPRYGIDLDDTRDPAGGRAQRPRGLVHQGLLRRPGDGRAALLPRQAQPPPARPAAARRRSAAGDRPMQFGDRTSAGSAASPSRRASARSRSRWCAARRRPARRSPSAPTRCRAVVVELPSEPERRVPHERLERVAVGRGSSASCGVSGCEASQVPTIRTSSTSSGGTWAPELADPAAPGQRGGGARAQARRRRPGAAPSRPAARRRARTRRRRVASGAARAPAADARGWPPARRRAGPRITPSRRARRRSHAARS